MNGLTDYCANEWWQNKVSRDRMLIYVDHPDNLDGVPPQNMDGITIKREGNRHDGIRNKVLQCDRTCICALAHIRSRSAETYAAQCLYPNASRSRSSQQSDHGE